MRGAADGASLPVRRITHELRTLSSSSPEGTLPSDWLRKPVAFREDAAFPLLSPVVPDG